MYYDDDDDDDDDHGDDDDDKVDDGDDLLVCFITYLQYLPIYMFIFLYVYRLWISSHDNE